MYTDEAVMAVVKALDDPNKRAPHHDVTKCLSCRGEAINLLDALATAGLLAAAAVLEEETP